MAPMDVRKTGPSSYPECRQVLELPAVRVRLWSQHLKFPKAAESRSGVRRLVVPKSTSVIVACITALRLF